MPSKKFGFISYRVQIEQALDRELEARVFAAGNTVRNECLKTLRGNRHGRLYRVPGTKVYYRASAPGEPPATRTGALRQSLRVVVFQNPEKLVAQVGTDLEYGKNLEFGTRKILPRPWFKPSYQRAKPRVYRILGRRWK